MVIGSLFFLYSVLKCNAYNDEEGVFFDECLYAQVRLLQDSLRYSVSNM